jgi:lysine-N-methylase
LSYERDGDEEYDDFDFILYSKLVDARDIMREFLQNRELDIKVRAGLMLGMAHDMQVRINHENIFGCEEVFERYQTQGAIEHVKKKIEMAERRPAHIRHEKAEERFQKLHDLELLRADWQIHLWETEDILYKKGAAYYVQLKEEFDAWIKEHLPQWDIMSEQLLVYFLHTYFCGAVYDGSVFAKARMAADSVFYIYEMLAARWIKNEKFVDVDDVIEITYRYSREVEHSDDNLKQVLI